MVYRAAPTAGRPGFGYASDMSEHVWLIALKNLDDDARAIKLGEVAGLELGEGQRMFVGDPLRMMLMGLEEDSRFPYVMDSNGSAVGVATLQAGAARAAGWDDDDSVWLLRGQIGRAHV